GSAPGEEDPNAEVDAALLDYLDQSPWTGEYDLIDGLVGVGVYALERVQRSGFRVQGSGLGSKSKSAIHPNRSLSGHPATGRRLLARVVERLGELAVRDGRGISWFTPPEHLPLWHRERCPGGYFNLGL